MGVKLALCCLAIMCVGVAIGLDPNCPLSSSMTSCSPKCKEDSECFGRKCCSNICNTKSCVPANHKDNQNNGYKNQNSMTSRPRDSPTFFSPEAVRPLPKAAPRSKSNRGRKRKCAILTDTPEKSALEEEAKLKNNKKKSTAKVKVNKEKQRVKERKVEKKEKKSSKQPRDRVKKKVLQESSEDDDDEDETICLGCGSSYSEDISGVDWVECISCKQWSHITCIKGDAVAYVCTNCNSDSDYDD